MLDSNAFDNLLVIDDALDVLNSAARTPEFRQRIRAAVENIARLTLVAGERSPHDSSLADDCLG
jgi:hypothetical protein